jgi:hypothetical protein
MGNDDPGGERGGGVEREGERKRGVKSALTCTIDTIDYVPGIGNASRASKDIIDFSMAHPSCDFLPKLCDVSSSSHRSSK